MISFVKRWFQWWNCILKPSFRWNHGEEYGRMIASIVSPFLSSSCKAFSCVSVHNLWFWFEGSKVPIVVPTDCVRKFRNNWIAIYLLQVKIAWTYGCQFAGKSFIFSLAFSFDFFETFSVFTTNEIFISNVLIIEWNQPIENYENWLLFELIFQFTAFFSFGTQRCLHTFDFIQPFAEFGIFLSSLFDSFVDAFLLIISICYNKGLN